MASATGHRPSTFRHWVDMIFEIATTAPVCGEAERARKFWRSPPRTLANRNRSNNQVTMTVLKTIEVEGTLECGCARKLANQPLMFNWLQ